MHPRAVWHAQTTITRRTTRPTRYCRRWRALHTTTRLCRPEQPASADDTAQGPSKGTPLAGRDLENIEKTVADLESFRNDVVKGIEESAVSSSPGSDDKETIASLNEKIRAARSDVMQLDKQLQEGGRARRSMRVRKQIVAEVPSIELPAWFTQENIRLFMDLKKTYVDHKKAAEARATPSGGEGSSSNRAAGGGTSRVENAAFVEMLLTLRASFAMVEHKAAASFAIAKAHLSLFSPIDGTTGWLKDTVAELAMFTGADVVSLDAFTLSRLGETALPKSSDVADHPIRSLSFDTHKEDMEEEMEEDEEDDEEDDSAVPRKGIVVVKQLKGGLSGLPRELSQILSKVGGGGTGGQDSIPVMIPGLHVQDTRDMARNSPEGQTITAMFDAVIDAWQKRRDDAPEGSVLKTEEAVPTAIEGEQSPSSSMLGRLQDGIKSLMSNSSSTTGTPPEDKGAWWSNQPRLIIQIADAASLTNTSLGLRLMDSLLNVVNRRRAAGEQITIIGLSASSRFAAEADAEAAQRRIHLRNADTLYRPFFLVPGLKSTEPQLKGGKQPFSFDDLVKSVRGEPVPAALSPQASWEKLKTRDKFLMNIKHILDMAVRIAPSDVEVSAQCQRLLSWDGHSSVGFDDTEVELRALLQSCMRDARWGGELTSRILEQSEAHAVALTLTGLGYVLKKEEKSEVTLHLLARALTLSRRAATPRIRSKAESWRTSETKKKDSTTQTGGKSPRTSTADPLETIRKSGNRYEQRLAGAAVSASKMKTTFDQVHVAPSTIEALKTLTSLSLQRPDAFSYGVLKADSIPGLLLYGPPGTGKTLLAKAVAKESGAAMLSISGADVNHMYVGESEKSVKAIFNVARKLAPCVVFIDEGDSIFGSRNQGRHKPSHRDTINQFLREWDGLDERSVFLMVATNRPFDLDDAVLRRLPRRVLVDLPTKEDREAILRIHLSEEQLDDKVDLRDLAEQTPFYSGSDLKNVAVAAALSCVREELDAEQAFKSNNNKVDVAAPPASQAAAAAEATLQRENAPTTDAESAAVGPSSTEDMSQAETDVPSTAFIRPARRILLPRHFAKALEEISASIGEDMSSLSAIKKFDEQYGDRKGRRKKSSYGFLDRAAEEKNARVRA